MFLKKFEIELPYHPAIPILGIYPEENDPIGYMHPSVHYITVYKSQDMEVS